MKPSIPLGLSVLLIPILFGRAQDTIRTSVDLVVVPASVRDSTGRFIHDLKAEDFVVLEDGKVQRVSQFSMEPSPLSAVVLLDTGMGAGPLRRFAASIVSLSSAFTEVDEASIYRFDQVMFKLADFTSDIQQLEKSLGLIQKMAENRKDSGAVPFLILPGRGPRWLRWLLDIGVPTKVLNDALFEAALDLEKRGRDRRKIVVVISDGQVAGENTHSLAETRARLAASQIQVYTVGVGMSLLEGPTSALHAYADATGGDVYRARNQSAMESAFSQIMVQARHQYVLGYISNNEVPGGVAVNRSIRIKANRPGLSIHHRKSYVQYPAPK